MSGVTKIDVTVNIYNGEDRRVSQESKDESGSAIGDIITEFLSNLPDGAPTEHPDKFIARIASDCGVANRRMTLHKSDVPEGMPDRFMGMVQDEREDVSFGGEFVKNIQGRYYLNHVSMPDGFEHGDTVTVHVVGF